jgi:hypothetical protein
MLGVAIYGVTLLETKFEAEWFLPPDSYLIKWFDASKGYFPSDGVQVCKATLCTIEAAEREFFVHDTLIE